MTIKVDGKISNAQTDSGVYSNTFELKKKGVTNLHSETSSIPGSAMRMAEALIHEFSQDPLKVAGERTTFQRELRRMPGFGPSKELQTTAELDPKTLGAIHSAINTADESKVGTAAQMAEALKRGPGPDPLKSAAEHLRLQHDSKMTPGFGPSKALPTVPPLDKETLTAVHQATHSAKESNAGTAMQMAEALKRGPGPDPLKIAGERILSERKDK